MGVEMLQHQSTALFAGRRLSPKQLPEDPRIAQSAAADQTLDELSAATQPVEMRKRVATWLGNARGAHGVASLFGRGDEARRTLPMSAEELLEAQALIYLRGLGLSAANAAR